VRKREGESEVCVRVISNHTEEQEIKSDTVPLRRRGAGTGEVLHRVGEHCEGGTGRQDHLSQ
jgi:hypothetical protein